MFSQHHRNIYGGLGGGQCGRGDVPSGIGRDTGDVDVATGPVVSGMNRTTGTNPSGVMGAGS